MKFVSVAVAAVTPPRPPVTNARTASRVSPQSGEVGSNELGNRLPLVTSSCSIQPRADSGTGADAAGGATAPSVSNVSGTTASAERRRIGLIFMTPRMNSVSEEEDERPEIDVHPFAATSTANWASSSSGIPARPVPWTYGCGSAPASHRLSHRRRAAPYGAWSTPASDSVELRPRVPKRALTQKVATRATWWPEPVAPRRAAGRARSPLSSRRDRGCRPWAGVSGSRASGSSRCRCRLARSCRR